jgi:hypothetical protein
MSRIVETIKKELLSRPYVTYEALRFVGIEFRLNKREMRHIYVGRSRPALSDGCEKY